MSASATSALHRHPGGAAAVDHVEHELRYLRPKKFRVPERAGSLRLAESGRANGHVDYYFDAAGDDGPLLRGAGCSLRVRTKDNGEVLATFKRKDGADKGALSARQECEQHVAPLVAFSALNAKSDIEPFERARAVAGEAPLAQMFSISNKRVDHHFAGADGHVVISEDDLVYPDGSTEQRLEVELVEGDVELLELIEAQLRDTYPKLKAAKRGKLSEGRRRMARLLGC